MLTMPNILTTLCQKRHGKTCKPIWFAIVFGLTFSMMGIGVLGYHQGYNVAKAAPLEENNVLRETIKRKQDELAQFKKTEQAHLDALALKLGRLQAHMLRVEALGDRLIEVGKLDQKEFDFHAEPPQGGPEDVLAASINKSELSNAVKLFAATVDDRNQKLQTLERVLLERNLSDAIRPSGYPVRKGWVSSTFGKRKDPFTGKVAYHKGIDIAGKSGTDILSVGAGVVTFSDYNGGHGRMVEVLHGSGVVSRYAHNLLNLVDVGDTVKKGEVIALIGQSGRATGPHLHFEVIKNNQHVNPERYLKSRK